MARGALTVGAIIEIVLRGIPAIIGTPGIALMFGLDYDIGFIPYVHAFGAVMIVFGIMMFIAAKVPERNTLVINMAILRFALGIVAQAWTFVQMGGVPHVFWIVQMVIDAIMVLWLLAARSKVMAKIA
jgi:hypothetical protein